MEIDEIVNGGTTDETMKIQRKKKIEKGRVKIRAKPFKKIRRSEVKWQNVKC